MSIKRYNISGLHPHIIESKDGFMVYYEDYAWLKAEVERLTKAGDAVALDYAERIEIEAGETAKTLMNIVPVLRDWNAARECKPGA